MKKVLVLFIFIFSLCFSNAQQSNIDLSKWYAFKIYTSGVNDLKNADILARTIEKNQFAIFSAFNPNDGTGYAIVEKAYLINEIEKYINNMLDGIKIEQYESAELNDDLFLNIYMLRGNIPEQKKSSQLPEFIQLGPYTQLSKDLYTLAKSVWIKKYPEAYKALTPDPKPLTPEEQEERSKKSTPNN